MSSIFSRFKEIFQARANAVADQMEDPKASLDYSLTRLEENRRQLSRSLVEVAAAKERPETQRDQVAAAVDKYEGQARAAVEADREDLARTALERKQEAEARQAELESNITRLEGQLDHLKQSQVSLDRKIALFRSKKEELKSIYDSSQAQLREALSGCQRIWPTSVIRPSGPDRASRDAVAGRCHRRPRFGRRAERCTAA